MPAALVIYCTFLAIEGGLALLISGNAFLLATAACGVLFYAAVWRLGIHWGEICRGLFAGLIAVAGPIYYQAAMVPTLLCFLALSHLLAATQSFWEIALSREPASQNMRMRTVVFTVAFYSAMGLVFVLLRGAEPQVPVWITAPLAVLVLILALPAWDLARVTRLKPGAAPAGTLRGVLLRRLLMLGGVLGMIAALFSFALPAAAEKLCEVSPRWRMKVESPESAPPRPPPPPQDEAGQGKANRPGMDASAMTGRHELPRESDIVSTGAVALYLKPATKELAAALAASGTVYVRSHTFDDWQDGAWTSSVKGGRWIEDADDGAADGLTAVRQSGPAAIAHTIYLNQADGYSLPALQGVSAYRFPRVFSQPGELYQQQVTGNIRYEAISTPVNWDRLPGRERLKAGKTSLGSHTRSGLSPVMLGMVNQDPLLRPDNKPTLAAHIDGIRQWMQENVRYSTKVEGDPRLTPLDNFLTGERAGFCDFYATAACALLRVAGIPTRIAYGYAGERHDSGTGVWEFTDNAAHAWTEIYVEGHGWTICDFTPPQNIGQLDEERPQSGSSLKEDAYEDMKPEPPPEAPAAAPETFSFNLSQWWNGVVEEFTAADGPGRILMGLKWLAVIGAAVLLVRWLLTARPEGKNRDALTADESQPAYFAEFLRVFREAGYPRAAGATPREYLDFLLSRGVAGREFEDMISYHYQHRYAEAEADRGRESEWLALVRETGRRLSEARQQK